MRHSILVIAVVMAVFRAGHARASDPCKLKTVHQFQAKSYAFPIAYQVLPGKNSALPVLLYIQGGPGQPIIGTSDSTAHPYTIVRMDLPGTGCNDPSNLAIDQIQISSDAFADLWLELVEELQLKRVAVFGISYGTVIATKLATRIEKTQGISLEEMILQGTVGKALAYPQLAAGFVSRWQEERSARKSLTDQALANLPALGLTNHQIGIFIQNALGANYYVDASGQMANELDILEDLVNSDTPRSQIESDISFIQQVETFWAWPAHQNYVYNKLNCEEFNPSGMEYNLDWQSPNLALPTQGYCANSGWTLNRPYDPANYEIMAPLFYVHGVQDPNAPMGGALYHVQSLTKSNRQFLTVANGGHMILTGSLKDCAEQLITTLLTNHQWVSSDFQSCANTGVSLYDLPAGKSVED